MDKNVALRELDETGKGYLQWERDIPASSLANFESLANFDFNLKTEIDATIAEKVITPILNEILQVPEVNGVSDCL